MKLFFPIGIRQLQIFLVKIALVLGVQIHDSVTFRRLIFPKPNENGIGNAVLFEINDVIIERNCFLSILKYFDDFVLDVHLKSFLIENFLIVEGWRAEFYPLKHILSDFVFDVLIGADGKRNTVPGL